MTDEKRDTLADPRLAFLAFVRSSSAAVIMIDPDARVVLWSPAAESVFGWSAEEVVGQPLPIVPPEGRPEFLAEVDRLRAGGAGRSYEALRLRRDGTTIAVHVTTAPLRSPTGELIGLVGLLEDVSQQRLADEALRWSRDRLTLAIEAAGAGLFDHRLPMGADSYHSERWAGILGYRVDELPPPDQIEAWLDERVHPEDRALLRRGNTDFLSGRCTRPCFEFRIRHRDDHWVWLRTYVTATDRNEAGHAEHVVGLTFDVTEEKYREAALQLLAEAGRRLWGASDPEAVLEDVACLAVRTLADACVFEVSSEEDATAAARFYVAAEKPALQRLLAQTFTRPRAAREPDCAAERALRTGRAVVVADVGAARGEVDPALGEVLASHGLVSLIALPLALPERTYGLLTLMGSRVRQRYSTWLLDLGRELAEQVARALEKARLMREMERVLQARQRILAIVSHDLRSPLRAIGLTASAMEDQEGRPDPRDLARIERSVAQMDRLIDDLLDVARLEVGQLTIRTDRVDISATVRTVLDRLAPIAQKRTIGLRSQLPDTLPAVEADIERLAQVLENLLSNALKFTPRGGTVWIEAHAEHGELRVMVGDTGPGIPAKRLAGLFVPFYQSDDGLASGAGLGLAIAKGIVDAHGGRIRAESPREGGARFHFSLPLADQGEGRQQRKPRSSAKNGSDTK